MRFEPSLYVLVQIYKRKQIKRKILKSENIIKHSFFEQISSRSIESLPLYLTHRPILNFSS